MMAEGKIIDVAVKKTSHSIHFAKTKSSDKKSGISGTFSFLHRYYFSI
jgi:hypothetical protein